MYTNKRMGMPACVSSEVLWPNHVRNRISNGDGSTTNGSGSLSNGRNSVSNGRNRIYTGRNGFSIRMKSPEFDQIDNS